MKYLKYFNLFENKSPLLQLSQNVDFDLVRKFQNLIKSGTILEISCGNGADALYLSEHGFNVTTTDNNPEYVDFVSQFIDCRLHDTKKKFPFDDEQFDLVYSRLGLHYFTTQELKNIFAEISRITNKYLVYSVKLVNDIQTGKVILDEETWLELTSDKFEIMASEVKDGLLYGNESKWLEVVAIKK